MGRSRLTCPRRVTHELEQGVSVGVLDNGGADLLRLVILRQP